MVKEYWAYRTLDTFLKNESYWRTVLLDAPEVLCIPPYYQDPVGNATARKVLDDQTSAALYWALNHKIRTKNLVHLPLAKNTADAHMLNWALHTHDILGKEAEFILLYEGHKFLDAIDYLDGDVNQEFLIWLDAVYLPIAKGTAFLYKNNHGAWGWCTFLRALRILNRPITPFQSNLEAHIKNAIEADGKMSYEVRRTNSGMWYIYFALAPYARVLFDFLEYEDIDLFELIEPALDWYFGFCQDPSSWPYNLPYSWPFKQIYKLLWPCTDNLQVPQSWDWPANLFENLATRRFDRPDWLYWIQRPIMNEGLNIFKYSTLTWSNDLEN